MRGLIEQMLDLARADSGQAEAAFEQVDLSRTAEDSLLLFEPLYFEQGLTLYAEIEEGILIWGLKDRLSQLLDILLDNACKYSSQGGTTWVKLKKQGKSHCILTVENQGPSIDPEDLSQIFKRFYRADPARNTSGSYGLGLSIAEKTVQLHHGKIHAESRGWDQSILGGAALCSGAWCAGLRFPAIKSDDSLLHPYISSAILKPYFRFLKERPDVNLIHLF